MKKIALVILSLSIVSFQGCDWCKCKKEESEKKSKKTHVQLGDTTKVLYTGRLENGTIFDSTANREPLGVEVGKGRLIPGFEKALLGMQTGETKSFKLTPNEAYGPHRPELVVAIDKHKLDKGINPQVGQTLQLNLKDNRKVLARILKVEKDSLIVDQNHQLAGQNLMFDIKVLEIQ